MSLVETTIVGKQGTKVGVTGQNELLVRVSSADSSGSGALATEVTLDSINTKLITYNTGVITPNVLTPALPFNTSGTENSVTIIVTTGTVGINGATLPVGTYPFKCGSNETLEAMTVSNVAAGAIIVLTTIKN